LIFAICCLADVIKLAISRAADIDFTHDVQPILSKRCAKCHSGTKREGGCRSTRGSRCPSAVKVAESSIPARNGESRLMARITATDNAERMPPEGEGNPIDRFLVDHDFKSQISNLKFQIRKH
jgi:hypothetical protein